MPRTHGTPWPDEIIDIDTRRGQVQLSLKPLQEDPLLPFADQAGLVTTGRVTKLIPFGAFVRIADGIEGLVHNTEFRDEPVEDPGQIVSERDEITVRIVEVDLVRRRLALSARNLPQSGTICLRTGSDLQAPCTAPGHPYS
ncbi:S1 RNA-binding domain-containing protein [Streptomyces anulatus]